MLSRRFLIKTIFMGVVARPLSHRKFNGKIFLEWVSKTRFIPTLTPHKIFSNNAIINDQIKNGDCRSLVDVTDATDEDLRILIWNACHLDKYVGDRLEFYYVTKVGKNCNTKIDNSIRKRTIVLTAKSYDDLST